jgi:hypothetical protein
LDAAWLPKHYFRLKRLPFRIVAPQAAQRTAFKKDCRADTGPIMDGKFADVKDRTTKFTLQSAPAFDKFQ